MNWWHCCCCLLLAAMAATHIFLSVSLVVSVYLQCVHLHSWIYAFCSSSSCCSSRIIAIFNACIIISLSSILIVSNDNNNNDFDHLSVWEMESKSHTQRYILITNDSIPGFDLTVMYLSILNLRCNPTIHKPYLNIISIEGSPQWIQLNSSSQF